MREPLPFGSHWTQKRCDYPQLLLLSCCSLPCRRLHLILLFRDQFSFSASSLTLVCLWLPKEVHTHYISHTRTVRQFCDCLWQTFCAVGENRWPSTSLVDTDAASQHFVGLLPPVSTRPKRSNSWFLFLFYHLHGVQHALTILVCWLLVQMVAEKKIQRIQSQNSDRKKQDKQANKQQQKKTLESCTCNFDRNVCMHLRVEARSGDTAHSI